ncbi:hypothetical protein J26TS2_28180 [Shouchella clausii]|uniref:thioredoxin family protein n=1 Tax=Shouchella tritolerans TaxID=2979466 RepID=UPI000788A50F|nr:thioredoxin family protein [Shouchella tritolerans]GIN12951.1 hypothetical protein J26TS2_28180 [Shouchella clausii]
MKKLLIIGAGVLALFIVLIIIQTVNNNNRLANNDLYDKDDLNAATIDQLNDENYQNIIMPDALAEKLEAGEDAVVYFFSPTCQYCKKATPKLMDVAGEEDIHIDQFNVLEYDDSAYGIEYTPTLIYFEDGKEVDRIVGDHTEDEFRDFLETTKAE